MNERNAKAVESTLVQNPDLVNHRSADGRGALWWAFEFEFAHGLAALMAAGADADSADTDEQGSAAKDMCPGDADALITEAKGLLSSVKASMDSTREQLKKLEEEDLDDEDFD